MFVHLSRTACRAVLPLAAILVQAAGTSGQSTSQIEQVERSLRPATTPDAVASWVGEYKRGPLVFTVRHDGEDIWIGSRLLPESKLYLVDVDEAVLPSDGAVLGEFSGASVFLERDTDGGVLRVAFERGGQRTWVAERATTRE